MSGRCPVDEIKVRWTLACTEATGVMAARSHYWHLHLVATSEQSLPVLLLLGWLQRRRKGASIRSQCAQLSADHRAKSSKSRISAGSGTEQRQPPLHYRTLSGKALSNLEPVACASGQIYSFSLGYTSSWGCSADLRTELWCVQRQPVSCSSHDNAGERTRTAPSIFGLVHFPATASSCEAFDLQASLSLR